MVNTVDTRPRTAARLPRLAAVAAALLVWWILTDLVAGPESLLREFGPQHVPGAAGELFDRGVLVPDIAVSMWRLLVGSVIAITVGIPLGLLLGLHAATEQAVAPVVQFLRMISPLSWAPIAVALFGIGNQPVIFLVAAASVWPIVLNTAAGVRAIDPGLLLVARSFGASRREQLSAVILPAIRAQVQTGIRIGLGIAWVVLVPAEMLGVRSGLGYQILNARDQLAYDQVVAVIVVIGVIGYALDTLSRVILDRR
ncbi:MAG: ABC transporter permease [Nocardia sp.]|nr:ABC transporter permease [Nocardia sp.]NUS92565.1 ABC transporter permease [Nocardia sp.]